MPSTVSRPITARVPNELVVPFRAQAERYGLTPSSALAALVAGAVALDQQLAGEATRLVGRPADQEGCA